MKSERTSLITSDNLHLSPIKTATEPHAESSHGGQYFQPEPAASDRGGAPAIECWLHTDTSPSHAVSAAVAGYVVAAASENTRRAYRHDLADFHRFGGAIPCSAEFLAEYIAFRASTCSWSTIARGLVGIGRAHTSLGFSDPGKTELVRTVLKGVRRRHGSAQRRAKPLMRDELLLSLPVVRRVRDVRDRAVLLLGFASALRRSELMSLDVPDLSFGNDGLMVKLSKSKTDPRGLGREIAIPYGRSSAACPVLATKAWMTASNAESGPLFRPINKAGTVGEGRLSASTVNVIIKRAVSAAGIEPAAYSGHSLRSGLITSAAQAGVSLHKIMEQSGHRSVQMLTRYIRDANLFDDNAAGAVL